MRARGGCGAVLLGALLVTVACLVFAALAVALILTGEVPVRTPYLTGLEPDPNYPFQPTTPITLTFDQPMDPDSVSASLSLHPHVPGALEWNPDFTQVAFVPEEPGYEPGRTYTVRLAAGAKAGTLPRTMDRSQEWSFSLQPLLDTLDPPAGADGLGPDPLLHVTFHYPLDCSLTSGTFSITPDAAGLLACADRTVTFSPTLPLAPDTAYVASLDSVYLEGDDWPRPGVDWSFTTAPPLTVEEVSPEESGFLVDLWTPFRITFSRPVVPNSAVSHLSVVTQDVMPVTGQLTWEQDGASLVFQPDEPLKPASQYLVTLESGVRDELGFELVETLERTYVTAPMLGLPAPVPGSQDVALDSAIRVPFTRPMDRASVEAGLSITPALEGTVSWEGDAILLIPRGGLAPETVYQISLSADIRDASGAPLVEPVQWTFATQAFLLDAQVPSDMVVTDLQQPIELAFALPMDHASVAAALTISPTTPGDLAWSEDARTVTFQPAPGWLAGANYEIILSASARTADGRQTLGEELVYAFSTAVAEVRFGEGPIVQVMGVDGERTVQVLGRDADIVDFRLDVVTPTQFLDLYSSGFRGAAPEEFQIVDTAGLTPTVVWREVLTPLSDQTAGSEWRPAEARIPAVVPPGMYVLSAEPPSEEQGQLLVVLTRHALVLKQALAGTGSNTQAQVTLWDTEIGGGAPVISATVRLHDPDGTLLAEGVTNASGLLVLEVPGDPGPLMAFADKDGDVTVCGLSNEWSETGWESWWSPPPSRALYTIYSQIDRPIYRPGQTVHFKSYIRASDDVSYTLPGPELPIGVRLRDARDNVAATQVLTPTSFGTVFGEFELADEPMLGTWSVETEVEGAVVRTPLEVEEYRRPEYKVTVHTPQEVYAHGEVISVTVDASYYFGQPVDGADVVLLAYPVYPELSDPGLDDETLFGYPIFSNEGRTDEQGRWLVALPAEDVPVRREDGLRAVLALEATVTDSSGQSVSSYQTVIVQDSSQGLALAVEQQGYRPHEEIEFSAMVRDRDGEPVAGVELTAHVLGWDEAEVMTEAAVSNAAGQAGFALSLAEQGWYVLRVVGTDDGGRRMEAEDILWVYDPTGRAPWYGGRWREEPSLTVTADRKTYQVGEVAQLVVYSPGSGPALLTFERGATRHAEPLVLVTGTNAISIPIRADYAPNIDVKVSQYGLPGADVPGGQSQPEAELQQASTQLLVPMVDRRLSVSLSAEQEVYGAGEEAIFHVRVTDYQEQPVVAEVSLAVVDEAIFALAEDLSQDPFDVFYGPRPNLVRTFDSLRPTRWLIPEEPGLGGAGEGEGGAPRRDFLDTAHWAPAIITDEGGEATIIFELPDNLTEWRVLARAITTDTLVGEAATSLIVSQDIVIRPALPRFLIQGDAADLAAVVHNFTAQPVSATIQLELEGLTLTVDANQIVHVPAGGSAAVTWPVLAEEPPSPGQRGLREAWISVRATASRGTRLMGRDEVESTLPIYPLVVPEITTFAGELAPAWPTETITFTLPTDIITDMGSLQVDLASSVAPGLLDGLDYLIGYPYGCVEQTMSRVLPNAVVSRAFRELGIRNELLEAEMPPMVEVGLQKLYGFQHNDGGWGWWYDDSTDLYQTAYVLFGLSTTEQAGFPVDDGVTDRAAQALGRMLSDADPRVQAYGAYVLAVAGRPLSVTLTLTDALELDLFSQAALAIALDVAGDEALGSGSAQAMVSAILDNLREVAIQDGVNVYWEEESEQIGYSRRVMGSTVRTTAMVTDALVLLDPESPLLPGAVRWLMEQRQGRGWGDTQKTSYAILAVTNYLLVSRELAAGSAFQVYLNGELWEEGVLDQAEVGRSITVPITGLLPAENRVQLVLGLKGEEPSGRFYHAVALYVNRWPMDDLIPALRTHERSIGVWRAYYLQGTNESTTHFREGDLVEVEVTLDVPEESWYVVIDDPLPAGFEALNERLDTTSHVAGTYPEPNQYWERYGYNRKDVRDDRVSFFVTHLEPGQHTFTYLMRATTAGDFAALPTQVYPMYEVEAWSRSEGTRCQVDMR